jgi:transcriptional regulator with XRE-family HTH domain
MKVLKDLRKSRRLALDDLSGKCGASAKTLLQYEHEPPKRPSKKAVGKISSALRIFPEDVMMIINKESVDIAEIGPDGGN